MVLKDTKALKLYTRKHVPIFIVFKTLTSQAFISAKYILQCFLCNKYMHNNEISNYHPILYLYTNNRVVLESYSK